MNKLSARSKHRKLAAGKPAKPGTTPADRRLLAQADRETAEAIQPPPRRQVALDEREFHSIVYQLKELTHHVVDAWATRDDQADGLENVLVKLHSARRTLETTVEVQP